MAELMNETAEPFDKDVDGTLPVLPLRDIVVFPHMIVPLFVGREKSVNALEEVMQSGKQILLLAQKDPEKDDPEASDLYTVGTIGSILQLLKLPDGTIKVLVEGGARICVDDIQDDGKCLHGKFSSMEEKQEELREQEVVAKSLELQFESYVKLNKKTPPEVLVSVAAVEDVDRLADTIASHLNLKLEDKQALLELTSVIERLERLYIYMEEEMEILQVDKRIRSRVKRQMEKSQREYYLSEQMKAIQKELGEEDSQGELDEMAKKIEKLGMTLRPKQRLRQS